MSAAFIGVDWGSTNRRAWALAGDGRVVAGFSDARGLMAVASGSFALEAAAIRARLGDLPMLCAGMVGSARGWASAPYLACPAGLGDLAAGLVWVEAGRTAIVPGLCLARLDDPAGDVMRGEEVQLLGAVAAGLAPGDALLCQPGTHCKWARMAGSKVAGFATAMTGEMFALLKTHSLLADFLTAGVSDGAAFREGVRAGFNGDLLSQLFRIRAAALLGRRAPEDSAAYASGLLIGADVGARALAPGARVHLLAGPALGTLYAAAIGEAGAVPIALSSEAAFIAGITEIWTRRHAH